MSRFADLYFCLPPFPEGGDRLNSTASTDRSCTLDLIGDKWTLLVVRDMTLGRTTFKEFSQSPEKIATNILSDRLAKLVAWGLVEKFPSEEHLGRDAYRLIEKGKSLKPVLMAMVKWGLANVEGSAQHLVPK